MLGRRAFSWVEALVVAVVLGVLAALFLPALYTTKHGPSRRTRCASNLKQIGYGLHLYSGDHGEAFPRAAGDPMASLGLLYPDYISDGKVFICPKAPAPARPIAAADVPRGEKTAATVFTAGHSDYGYDSDHTAAHPPGVAVAADKGTGRGVSPNHGGDGQNVLYIGGNVEWHRTSDCGYKRDHIYLEGFDGEGPDPGEEFHSHIRQ